MITLIRRSITVRSTASRFQNPTCQKRNQRRLQTDPQLTSCPHQNQLLSTPAIDGYPKPTQQYQPDATGIDTNQTQLASTPTNDAAIDIGHIMAKA